MTVDISPDHLSGGREVRPGGATMTTTINPIPRPDYESPGILSGWTVSEQVIQTPNGERYKIGYVGPDGYGRRTYQGPIVPGPWAEPIGQAIVIDNTGYAAAQNRALVESGLLVPVGDGDTLLIDGFEFTVNIDRGYPVLTING